MFTVLLAYAAFFFAFFVARDCVELDVDRITILPSPYRIFFPSHNSFFNTSDSYLKSAPPKAGFGAV